MPPEPMATAPTSIPLTYNGKTVPLPLIEGTEGEVAIDIRNLRAQTGLVTFDPGYANTGACKSAITFIDGEQGVLRYRGYPIEDLAERSSFLEDFLPPSPPEGTQTDPDPELVPAVVWNFPLALQLRPREPAKVEPPKKPAKKAPVAMESKP